MLRHASADIVLSDHDGTFYAPRFEETQSQPESRGTEASFIVCSPPVRPKPGKSTATGKASGDNIVENRRRTRRQ